jgi:hypothetical protein
MATLNRTFSVKNGLDVANTVVLDSSRNISNVVNANVTTVHANTVNSQYFFTSAGLNVPNQANNAFSQANAAYAAANTAANTVQVSQNGSGTLFGKHLNFVNTATITVNVTDDLNGNANIGFVAVGGAAFDQANAAYAQANVARDTANAAYGEANAAYSTANLKVASITGSGNGLAISNTTTANVNDYVVSVNVATTAVRGTTLLIDSISSNDTGNAATANAVKTAWDYANTKLSLAGGTVGSLNVSGNLTVTGNTKYVNVETYIVTDPLIYLAANNDTSDLVDIGFMGAHNTAGIYQHSGLARHAVDGKFYLFTGLQDEGHVNNVIDVANTTMATLRANLEANSITLMGNVVATQANLTIAHNQANSAYGQANLAYAQANTAYGQANDAYGQANAAYGQANAAYGQANTAYGQANDAFTQANAAYAAANNRVLKAGDTMTGALTINTSGTGLTVGNVNVTHHLTVSSLNVTVNNITTVISGQLVIDAFPTNALASAKYFVQANSGTDYLTTEIIVVQDGTNIWLTEYGTIQTGPSLGTFTADVDSGNARLLFNAVNNVNTIRSVRYGVNP